MKPPRKNGIDRDGIRKLDAEGHSWETIAVKLGYSLNTVRRTLGNGGKGRKADPVKPKAEPLPWDAQPTLNAVALLAKQNFLVGSAYVDCWRKVQAAIESKKGRSK